MSNNLSLFHYTLNPKELIKKRINHIKTQSVFQCAKRQLSKYDESQEQLFRSSLGIKEENNSFLVNYSKFMNKPHNNPNLIFKSSLNHYREKGYSIDDLSKNNLFHKSPLLDSQHKHQNKFQQEEADIFKEKSMKHSEKAKKYILKLDHMMIKKKMLKGIYKPHMSNMTITTKANGDDSIHMSNLKSNSVIDSNKQRKYKSMLNNEINDLIKYNKSIEDLINIETKNDLKKKPLFKRQTTFKMKIVPKNFNKINDLISLNNDNSIHNKDFNEKKYYYDDSNSLLNNKSLFIYREEATDNLMQKKLSDNQQNRIMNKVFLSLDKENNNKVICANTEINFYPISSTKVSLSEGCSLEVMNCYDSYQSIKRQIKFYLKKSNYTQLQIDNLMKNCYGYHDLLKLISKLKKQSMSYDIKNKTPTKPEGVIKERLNKIEESIRFLDRNYINKLFKSYNQ